MATQDAKKAILVVGAMASLGAFDLESHIDAAVKRHFRGKPNSDVAKPKPCPDFSSDTRQQRRARERAAKKVTRRG